MDPITTAIVAGIAKLAEPAVRDAYEALKKLLARKFTAVKEAADALEQTPASQGRRMVLQEEVTRTGAERDEELRAAVAQLVKSLGAAPGGGNVTQTVTGSGNVFSGTGSVNVEQK